MLAGGTAVIVTDAEDDRRPRPPPTEDWLGGDGEHDDYYDGDAGDGCDWPNYNRGGNYYDSLMMNADLAIEPVELDGEDIDRILSSLEADEMTTRNGGAVPTLEDRIGAVLEEKYARKLEERKAQK